MADAAITGINAGDTIIINSQDIFDNTLIYSIIGITGGNEIIINKKFSVDIIPGGLPYEIVKFTGAPGSVDEVRPLLGHIHMAYPLVTGSYVKFNYYYTDFNQNLYDGT